MSWDGNLLSHPNLLPPPHFPMPAEAVEYVKKQLPKYARLEHNPASVTVYDLNTGIPHKHHGYSIVIDDDDVVEQSGELRVSMSARYLDHVDMSELAAYLLTVKDVYGLRCSRFDAALDDHEKQIPLSVVEQARCDRNFFNVRTTSVVVSDNITRNEIGRTMYFGSRQSEAFLRVYDKTIESRGKRIGNRWESEFKGKKAINAYTNGSQQWQMTSEQLIGCLWMWCLEPSILGTNRRATKTGNDAHRSNGSLKCAKCSQQYPCGCE